MQEKECLLLKFYKTKFLNTSITNFSSPMLISLKNVNTDVIIVGQETNSWYGSYKDFLIKGVSEQMNIYDNFIVSEFLKKSSPYHTYVKEICGGNMPTINNLFKFDLGDNSNKKSILSAKADEIKHIVSFHDGVLMREIEIISPKIIIFFTGPRYEAFLDRFMPNDKMSIDGFKLNELCELKLKYFPSVKAYRTYHPGYLNRQFNKFGARVREFLKGEVE